MVTVRMSNRCLQNCDCSIKSSLFHFLLFILMFQSGRRPTKCTFKIWWSQCIFRQLSRSYLVFLEYVACCGFITLAVDWVGKQAHPMWKFLLPQCAKAMSISLNEISGDTKISLSQYTEGLSIFWNGISILKNPFHKMCGSYAHFLKWDLNTFNRSKHLQKRKFNNFKTL